MVAAVVIAAILPVAHLVATEKTVPVRLLVLIPTVVPVITVPIPVEVRSLRIVALPSLCITRAGIETVLVTLVNGNLASVAIAAVPVTAIGSVAVSAIRTIGTVCAISPVLIVPTVDFLIATVYLLIATVDLLITTVVIIPIAIVVCSPIATVVAVFIAVAITIAITILRLHCSVCGQSDSGYERHCQQDSSDSASET